MAQLSPQEINYLQNGPPTGSRNPLVQSIKTSWTLTHTATNPTTSHPGNRSFPTWLSSEADAWQENMSVQAAEYDAAIVQKAYDEQYNQPSEQVARMNAAGLNPDISGGENINPGEAAKPLPRILQRRCNPPVKKVSLPRLSPLTALCPLSPL